MSTAPRLYRRREAAQFLGISEDRLAAMAVTGTGPAFHKPIGGRAVIYTEAALIEWLGAPMRSTTESKARTSALSAA